MQRQKRKLVALEEKDKLRRTFQMKVAIEICKMCKGSTTEAQQYLHMHGCMRDAGHPWSRETVLGLVGSTVVEPCAHSSSSCDDDATTSIASAAQSYLLGNHTFRWVREQNEKKGIAPMMQTTLRKYESLKSETFTEAKGCELPKTTAGKYKWTRRWAKTWKVWKGRLKSGTILPPEQRRDKVNSSRESDLFGHIFQNGSSGGGKFPGKELCPNNGSRK